MRWSAVQARTTGARRAKTAMSATDGFAPRMVVWLARWVLREEMRAAVLASSSSACPVSFACPACPVSFASFVSFASLETSG